MSIWIRRGGKEILRKMRQEGNKTAERKKDRTYSAFFIIITPSPAPNTLFNSP
jgi:hypothetical protein